MIAHLCCAIFGLLAAQQATLPRRTHILEQTLAATFAPEAAFAVAAKARGRVELVGAVDPDAASLDLAGHIQRQIDIIAPDAGRQAIARIVRQRHRLFWRAERHRNQHRPKDFLLHDGRCRGYVGKERRRKEIALRWAGPRRLPERAALGHTLIDQALNLSNCAEETIAPISTALSSGSPRRSFSIRSRSLAIILSATFSCTSSREPAQHTCP